MFLEILQPQGDPFAEPQVQLMNYLVQSGVVGELADKLDARLSMVKLVIGNFEIGSHPAADHSLPTQREEEIAKIELYLNRLLLLWNVLMKYCADLFPLNYPASRLVVLVDRCMELIDPSCKQKKLQMEYLKFLKKLLGQSDESVAYVIVESSHFITVIKKVNKKENMISAQVKAIFEEMKKLQWFKLHQHFVETYKDTLESLKVHNKAIDVLLNHNKRMRHNIRSSSHIEEEKQSEKQSEKRSVNVDFTEPNGISSPLSAQISSPGPLGDLDPMSLPQLEGLFKKIRNSRHSDDEENGDAHDVFLGINFKVNESLSGAVQIVPETEVESKSAHRDRDGENGVKLEITFDLGKRNSTDNDQDDDNDEALDDGSLPVKRLSTK